MQRKQLSKVLKKRSDFAVVVELTASAGFGFEPIDDFLAAYKQRNESDIPAGFNLVGITSPQTPGGTANIDPTIVLSHIKEADLLGDLDFIPHITCKDQNTDALISSLMAFRTMDVDSNLAVTGDKPQNAKGVFELDSVGLIDLISDINDQSYIKAKPDQLENIHQFFTAAAVSPFKYSEPSQMQQYFKMEKKIAAGADFLITQVGWDWKKSLELFTYLKEKQLDIPVLGNVFVLTTTTQAPRLMHSKKLAGCFVSDQLYEKLRRESLDDHLERAAQQIAMYKAIGAAGVDIGSLHDYQSLIKILKRADEIGDNWLAHKDNLYWPPQKTFYLYDDNGHRLITSKYKKTVHQRFFNFVHSAVLDENHPGFHIFKKTMSAMGARKGKGFAYRSFASTESAFKYMIFDCRHCGDCFLPENFGYCTMGSCEKGLANVPCGDATADGYCGNNLERVCIGEKIYKAAAAEKGGMEKLIGTTCQPRNHHLEDTSSILNYLFAVDHTRKSPLINIAELINSAVPSTRKIMQQLIAEGPNACSNGSATASYIRSLIKSQVRENPEYINVFIDMATEDTQKAQATIAEYAKMIGKLGRGAAISIESANEETLTAGLKAWYENNADAKPPLLYLASPDIFEKSIHLRKIYNFSIAIPLAKESSCENANTLFGRATGIIKNATEAGFKPEQIYFDIAVTPLAKDVGNSELKASATNIAFETIRMIKQSPATSKTHCVMKISLSAISMPRRTGICRAYAAAAMQAGLDAAVVTASHRYGLSEPAPELLKLVKAYAEMDGTKQKLDHLIETGKPFMKKTTCGL